MSKGKTQTCRCRKFLRCAAWLLVGLLSLPLPALAEKIVWNGPGDPANTIDLQADPLGMVMPHLVGTNSLLPSSSSGNTITINGDVTADGISFGNVYGGGSIELMSGNALAQGNRVILNKGQVGYRNSTIPQGPSLMGGGAVSLFGSATATGNYLTINGGTVFYDAAAGAAVTDTDSINVIDNHTVMNGGYVGDSQAAPNASGSLYGGSANSMGGGMVMVNANSVTFNGGTVMEILGGSANSADVAGSKATSNGNTVFVNGGSVGKSVTGGFAIASGGSEASYNVVVIKGGSFGDTTDSWVHVSGGTAAGRGAEATANNNIVFMAQGHVKGNVAGGHAGDATGTASRNTVLITGGTIERNVYGGFVSTQDPASFDTSQAIDNAVTIAGKTQFGPGSSLYGGYIWDYDSIWPPVPAAQNTGDYFSDNVLFAWNYSGGSSFQEIGNFEFYDFILPSSNLGLSADTVYFDNSIFNVASKSSTVDGLNIMGGGSALQPGDSVALITYNSSSGTIANDGMTINGQKGVSLFYEFLLKQNNNDLTATVLRMNLNPQLKSLAEGRLAGLAFANQGADLIAGAGLEAARVMRENGEGLTPFVVVQGGSSRYDTGSHVDVDGFSTLAGLAWNQLGDYGQLTLGAFFEAGWGNYDSHNSFNGYASVNGDGDTEYYGGGVLGRFDFSPVDILGVSGNAYIEASLRAGWAETDFSTSDIRDIMGNKVNYDSGSAYYGAHLGLGYILDIGEASSLDIYTKYFWTHQDSDSVSAAGDPVKLKSADSHRWRGGLRFAHELNTAKGMVFTPYLGVAYEYEFDGEAKATTYGHALDAPDLKGGTGMGELGLSLKPSADCNLSFDLGVQGYVGVREGVTGNFQLKWAF